ncbi:hypothetical protein [Holdemania sp. Marseille-P2844]|uniref:hypothetical protein n=1 Tax=Holdemania sp. Marseille-P2844 TaxID=1852366 RepID=UPI0011147778|nr:hypothetical protein [Holdemania sp. Marseille-P2844]
MGDAALIAGSLCVGTTQRGMAAAEEKQSFQPGEISLCVVWQQVQINLKWIFHKHLLVELYFISDKEKNKDYPLARNGKFLRCFTI